MVMGHFTSETEKSAFVIDRLNYMDCLRKKHQLMKNYTVNCFNEY